LYARIDARAMLSFEKRPKEFTCVPQMTLYSAVFASPSRVRLAHAHGVSCSTAKYRQAAARHGTIESLAAAREIGMQYNACTMESAAQCNLLPVLQFLHADGCPWDRRVPSAAASRGDLEILRWVIENGCSWDDYDVPDAAARGGNIEMMAWVQQLSGLAYTEATMAAAAFAGRTAMCKYLHAEQCPWDEDACYPAAQHGHVDTLRWLHENGCPWAPLHN
jgi:hypothetical protein